MVGGLWRAQSHCRPKLDVRLSFYVMWCQGRKSLMLFVMVMTDLVRSCNHFVEAAIESLCLSFSTCIYLPAVPQGSPLSWPQYVNLCGKAKHCHHGVGISATQDSSSASKRQTEHLFLLQVKFSYKTSRSTCSTPMGDDTTKLSFHLCPLYLKKWAKVLILPSRLPCREGGGVCGLSQLAGERTTTFHHVAPAAVACFVFWLVANQQPWAPWGGTQLSHQKDTTDINLYIIGQRQPLGNSAWAWASITASNTSAIKDYLF